MLDALAEIRDWWTYQWTTESVAFDERFGTDTVWFDWFNYEPTLPSVVEEALDGLDVTPEAVSFVDLGSGKGRVALMAATRGFRKVVGVEYRRRLHRAAERNLTRFREVMALSAPVDLVCDDVRTAALPDGPLVLYLFNPFPADVLATVLRRVEGRALRLIYVNPVEASVLKALGWTVCAEHRTNERVRSWQIYRPTT